MSEEDIQKGSRGLADVSGALHVMKVGIICLTPENANEPWILFEAGALSKTPDAKVCTYLLGGLKKADLRNPIAMFQATELEKEDTRKLVHTINGALDGSPVPAVSLDKLFDKMWPELQETLAKLPAPSTAIPPRRTTEEMIAEILELSRASVSEHTLLDLYEILDDRIAEIQKALNANALAAPPSGGFTALDRILKAGTQALKAAEEANPKRPLYEAGKKARERKPQK